MPQGVRFSRFSCAEAGIHSAEAEALRKNRILGSSFSLFLVVSTIEEEERAQSDIIGLALLFPAADRIFEYLEKNREFRKNRNPRSSSLSINCALYY